MPIQWADKYAPSSTNMILGNKEAVSKLRRWLDTWESTFNKPSNGKKKKPSFNSKNGPFKAALLSGPPGMYHHNVHISISFLH